MATKKDFFQLHGSSSVNISEYLICDRIQSLWIHIIARKNSSYDVSNHGDGLWNYETKIRKKKGWKRASRVLNEKKQCNQQLESALIWYFKPRDLESQFTAISSWENSSIKKNRCRK